MGISRSSSELVSLLSFIVLLSFSIGAASISSSVDDYGDDHFLQCLSVHQFSNNQVPVYTSKNSSFSTIFQSSARNLRFLSPKSTKPQFIITPSHESHVQAAVICCRKHGLDLKVRSGGHDVEGLSYVSDIVPFVMVDLSNFRNITIDVEDSSAWIQAGASLGEVYYRIGDKSKTLGFPAGLAPTVGVGGHLSGGGIGALVRKYGLAADQVIDAQIVNVDGKILNRKTMGKDLFWAIRGGGGASFGVILSWKVKLVPVPPIVTVATIDRTLEQDATNLVYRWQFVADRLDEDLYIGLKLSPVVSSERGGEKTVQAEFYILFLGRVDKLLQLMEQSFPELGLKSKDCTEMSWVESHIYFSAPGSPLELLLDRDPASKIFMKAKSDHVKVPISKDGLEGFWRRLLQEDMPVMLLTPYGGRMSEISESEIPFPHRVGNIYNILYMVNWFEQSETEKHIDWMRRLYKYMAPYVSKSPRTAYLNYGDLDLGQNENGEFSYSKARVWGRKYFKNNFERLVKVKSEVDPGNFFKNKQSIPPITLNLGKKMQD
ncbi:FAD linked oxidase [Macleaya cordata]|uniref:FAD linked oxidase n=1 Tax=Macleaya cordata TaxID=56857 RepID=A0A200QFU4_MACCD|nr:FAD linked oxidase [Macleaya cordata]